MKKSFFSAIGVLALFAVFLFVSGCGFFRSSDESYSYDQGSVTGSSYEYDMMAVESESAYMDRSLVSPIDDGGFVEGVEQKIIRTGDLSLHVDDVRESVDIVKVKAEELGGSVDDSEVTRYDTSYNGYLTVRVPSEQFETAMAALKELAIYVNSETTNADNITATYVDMQARLATMKAEEQQYLEILDQAVTVEEILQVTDYLNAVRQEIESTTGQLQYYDSQVDYSTITVTLTEDESIAVAKESWRPIGTIKDALSDWVVFLQGALDLGIYLVIFGWPVILVLWGVWVWVRKSGKKHKN